MRIARLLSRVHPDTGGVSIAKQLHCRYSHKRKKNTPHHQQVLAAILIILRFLIIRIFKKN
ncbi:MAG: hypothetical protein RLP02_35265, partial [Coleofasciculus sp. C2-GNP5-27]